MGPVAIGRTAGNWLALGLVALSGNPVLSNPAVAPVFYLLLAGLALAARRRGVGPYFNRQALWLAGGFAVVFAAHQLTFGVVSLLGSAHFIVKLLLGGWLIALLGRHFALRLFHAAFVLSAVGLACYAVLLATGPDDFPGFFGPELTGSENIKSIGIFTVHTTDEWWRNSSMMWEPGAFQGILNLAFFLVPLEFLKNPKNSFKLVVMFIALLTTFSTTGYIVFFLVLLYRLGGAALSGIAKWPLLGLVAVIAAVTVAEAEFLGQKIVEQFLDAQDYDGFMPDRFGALLFDLHYIDKNPLFGNGLIEDTRFADHPQLHGQTLGHGNGLSNFLATYGFFGLAVYVLGILRSGYGPGIGARLVLALLVATLAFGEQFLNYPLFLGLPFLATLPLRRRRRLRRRAASPFSPAAPAAAG